MAFSRYGEVEETRVTRDLVTGAPRGYGFVVFARRRDAAAARVGCRRLCLAGADVVVEAEFSRGLRGWRPRRLGGGLGGKKESGQLRFGGAARPFQVPVSEPTEPDRSRPRWTSDRVTDGGERVPDPAGGPGRHSGESAPSQRRGAERTWIGTESMGVTGTVIGMAVGRGAETGTGVATEQWRTAASNAAHRLGTIGSGKSALADTAG
ncbi:U11/U12 small nuclear ribonucleoprotein [Amphibalanus amphitrite]|uniref:U11/U12 small nuclear ribonucleoprotein n=1 Tax=Amphibalanus amphitrite TaxID=1232801 RepID=A0A6A4X612_AMPAM|nr:U11/U12 small nuclear ribonucleoprotein [Amphibalanus amphitrite]